jgi:hypothetical protein
LVSATFVLAFLRMKRFSIVTRPASSSLVRWPKRLPFVRPVARCSEEHAAPDQHVMRV